MKSYPSVIEKDLTSAENLAYPIGLWTSIAVTAAGIFYFLVILVLIFSGQFTFPPADWIQLFGGTITLTMAPLIVVVMACVHAVTPAPKKILSQVGLGFTLLFAIAVSINRFAQLGVVRQSTAAGNLEGIQWFLAYGDHSVFFALEMLGWAWFLGLAMLAAAPLFSDSGLERWIRGLMLLYAALALICAVAHLLGSPLAVIGFAAWGFVLFIITALLAHYFKKGKQA